MTNVRFSLKKKTQPNTSFKHTVRVEGRDQLWAIHLRVRFVVSGWLSQDILYPFPSSKNQKRRIELLVWWSEELSVAPDHNIWRLEVDRGTRNNLPASRKAQVLLSEGRGYQHEGIWSTWQNPCEEQKWEAVVRKDGSGIREMVLKAGRGYWKSV